MITLQCQKCGKSFSVKPYRAKTAKACSLSCASSLSYNKTLGKCDHSHLLGNKFREGKKPTNGFERGHAPWNKGKTHTEQTKAKIREARARQVGKNHPAWVPVGSIRQRKDKSGTVRNWIKIEEGKWEELAKHLWKKSGRKLVRGMCLHHINNRSDDDRIENLLMVSRQDHPKLHNR
jgi:hypothetical protein